MIAHRRENPLARRRFRCAHPSRRGAVVTEMAMALPLVVFVLLASFEVAKAHFMRHAARAAAYEGARAGIVPGTNRADIQNAVDFVLHTMGVRNAEVRITPDNFDSSTTRLRVDITIDANRDLFFTPYFFRDATFTGSCELSREVW